MYKSFQYAPTKTGLAPKILFACLVLLLIHTGMITWLAITDSPVPDEVKQIPSGISNWHGEYKLYRVTPPLVRYIANIPLLLSGKEIDWLDYPEQNYNRQETNIGRNFIESNGMEAFQWYIYGRLLCLPFSLLGGIMCFHWCRKLFGDIAGLISLTIWCYSPMILAHGHYITTDMASTSLGLLACYWFWRWLTTQEMNDALLTGVWLGLAVLAKTTCIVFFLFWPACLLISWLVYDSDLTIHKIRQGLTHVACMFVFAVIAINLGYLFSGTFTSLGDYTFKSKALAAEDAACFGSVGGNRFRDTPLGYIPVPLPYDFVQGIDWQKADFESSHQVSYLLGEHRGTGWWYYYIVGLATKEPLGIWILFLLAILLRCRSVPIASHQTVDKPGESDFNSGNQEQRSPEQTRNDKMLPLQKNNEWFLWAIAAMIFVFISSQTGLSRHTRYVMPAMPLLYIIAGSVGAWLSLKRKMLYASTCFAVCWLAIASVLSFPYSIGYFNELIGDKRNANQYLTGSNIDWGQDMLRLRQWIVKHPESNGLRYKGNHVRFDTTIIGTSDQSVPKIPGGISELSPEELAKVGPHPGWFAVSVNYLIPNSRFYEYFLELEPVAEIGYTTRIYYLTLEEANQARTQCGLPQLSGSISAEPELATANQSDTISHKENEDDNDI